MPQRAPPALQAHRPVSTHTHTHDTYTHDTHHTHTTHTTPARENVTHVWVGRGCRERTSGERMAIINCLALIMSQRPSLAREVVPHLSQIDPALPAAFEPGPLANVRQTLRLGLQYIYK